MFIEVTSAEAEQKYLINTDWISDVGDNIISLGVYDGDMGQARIKCKESYEEIKKLILEAHNG